MPDVRDQSPLATVITVTYNSAAYVRFAIESVLAQSLQDFELIIGDDASTDDTWGIINSYHDPRIRAYRNEKNLREYPNRNKAIRMARGKYLIFIDGDDVMYPHGLEFMVKMMQAFPDAAMAIMRPFHPKLIYPVRISSREVFVAEYFHQSLVDIAFTNTLFRTSAIREAGSLPETVITGDTYIRLKVAERYPALLINDNITWWRETPQQATRKHGNSVAGVVQKLSYRRDFLKATTHLSTEEKEKANLNIEKKVFQQAWRKIAKGKLSAGDIHMGEQECAGYSTTPCYRCNICYRTRA